MTFIILMASLGYVFSGRAAQPPHYDTELYIFQIQAGIRINQSIINLRNKRAEFYNALNILGYKTIRILLLLLLADFFTFGICFLKTCMCSVEGSQRALNFITKGL